MTDEMKFTVGLLIGFPLGIFLGLLTWKLRCVRRFMKWLMPW